jgi:acetate kinase
LTPVRPGPVLVVNAGSTSLKLHLVDGGTSEHVGGLEAAAGRGVGAVGHRVVHGGARFRAPAVLDDDAIAALRALTPLAPLHNAPALDGIAQARAALPDVPHVGVFDTAFHATIPEAAATYAIPRAWRDLGIRRYGFHGLAVEWCTRRSAELLGRPTAALRLVVLQLGGGSSATAVRDGRSVDTTMGFTPLDGIPMVTRPGALDPGAILYLQREHGLDADAVDDALEHRSGLVALAGGGDGVRSIAEAATAGDADAALALDVYVYRIAAAVATMAAAMGGLDALAFGGGVGERSPLVRRRVCERLAFLGIALDGTANDAAVPDADVAAPGSAVRVLVVASREELVIADHVRAALA